MKHKNPILDKKIRDSVSETKRNIKKAVLWLKDMGLVDSDIVSVPIKNDLALWLKKYFAIKRKLPDEVRQIIHDRIMISGMSSYYQISNINWPDHTMSPHALAYFLLNYGISYEKAKAIKFDHGDTLETFKATANGLLMYVAVQIMTPRVVQRITKNKRDVDYDPHPVCDCCC